MKDLKVCILSPVIPPQFDGAGRRAYHQAKYLARKGFKLSLITSTPHRHALPNLEIITVKSTSFWYAKNLGGRLSRLVYHFYLPFTLFRILNPDQIKILHCIPASSGLALLSILVAKSRRIRVIAETTLMEVNDPLALRKGRWGWIRRKIFDLSDVVVNLSPLLANRCRDAGLPEKKITLIPNGVDTELFQPPTTEKKKFLREKLGLDLFQWVFVYAGILRPRKGIRDLVEAFSAFHAEEKSSCLVLAGPTHKDENNISYYHELLVLARKYGLAGKVIFTGQVENVAEWLMAGDIFLFASRKEGFGTALIEAMSVGLPVIVRRIPQISEYIISHEEDGLITEDNGGMTEGMFSLVRDPAYRRKLSQNARATVLRRFSQDVVMGHYLDLYRQFRPDL